MLKVTNNSDAITLWDGSTGINAATFIAALNTLEVFTIYTWGIISDAGAQGGDFLRIFDNSTGNPILRHSMRDVSGELGVQSRVRTVTGGEQAGFIAGSTEIASGDWYVSGLHVDLRTTASGGGNSFVGVHADGGSVQDDPIDMTDLGGLEEPSAANARWFLADPGAGAAAAVGTWGICIRSGENFANSAAFAARLSQLHALRTPQAPIWHNASTGKLDAVSNNLVEFAVGHAYVKPSGVTYGTDEVFHGRIVTANNLPVYYKPTADVFDIPSGISVTQGSTNTLTHVDPWEEAEPNGGPLLEGSDDGDSTTITTKASYQGHNEHVYRLARGMMPFGMVSIAYGGQSTSARRDHALDRDGSTWRCEGFGGEASRTYAEQFDNTGGMAAYPTLGLGGGGENTSGVPHIYAFAYADTGDDYSSYTINRANSSDDIIGEDNNFGGFTTGRRTSEATNAYRSGHSVVLSAGGHLVSSIAPSPAGSRLRYTERVRHGVILQAFPGASSATLSYGVDDAPSAGGISVASAVSASLVWRSDKKFTGTEYGRADASTSHTTGSGGVPSLDSKLGTATAAATGQTTTNLRVSGVDLTGTLLPGHFVVNTSVASTNLNAGFIIAEVESVSLNGSDTDITLTTASTGNDWVAASSGNTIAYGPSYLVLLEAEIPACESDEYRVLQVTDGNDGAGVNWTKRIVRTDGFLHYPVAASGRADQSHIFDDSAQGTFSVSANFVVEEMRLLDTKVYVPAPTESINDIETKIVQPLAAIGCGVVFSSPAFRVDEDGESSDSQTNWRNAARLEAISGRRPYVYTTGYAKPGSGPQKLMRLYQADGGAHQAGPSTSLDLQNFATEASSVVLSGAAGRSVRKRGRRCRTHRA